MAADDAESLHSAPDEQPRGSLPERGKRQRAADLFSPHRYRELQVNAFERRAGRAADTDRPVEMHDDDVDPLLSSGAPAAEAARAQAEGLERHESFERFSPVEASQDFDFPFDPAAGVDDDGLEDGLGDDDFDQNAHDGDRDVSTTETAGGYLPGVEDVDLEYVEEDQVGSFDLQTSILEVYPPAPSTDAESAVEPVAAVMTDEKRDEPMAKKRRSAGRNMPVATAVGLALLGATVGAAHFHKLAFAALLYIFVVGAVIEWKRALERHGRRIPLLPIIAATLGLGVATYFGKAEGLVVALLVGCAGVVAWRIGDERIENTLADSLAGVLTLLWIPFLASFLFLLELADDGWQRVIIVVLAVVGNDTGALLAGVFFGRHKLLPRVSPAKTWEGAIGGVVLGTIAASVAAFFFFDGKWYIGTAVGVACAIAAAIGDLAESALKRDIQVKDMSSALPGHGGILDRIDSLLFAAPVGYVVFAMFLGTLGGGGL